MSDIAIILMLNTIPRPSNIDMEKQYKHGKAAALPPYSTTQALSC